MKAVRQRTLPPPYATKAMRGIADLWVVGSRFGVGTQPNVNTKGEGSYVLSAVVKALHDECLTVRITTYSSK